MRPVSLETGNQQQHPLSLLLNQLVQDGLNTLTSHSGLLLIVTSPKWHEGAVCACVSVLWPARSPPIYSLVGPTLLSESFSWTSRRGTAPAGRQPDLTSSVRWQAVELVLLLLLLLIFFIYRWTFTFVFHSCAAILTCFKFQIKVAYDLKVLVTMESLTSLTGKLNFGQPRLAGQLR